MERRHGTPYNPPKIERTHGTPYNPGKEIKDESKRSKYPRNSQEQTDTSGQAFYDKLLANPLMPKGK